MVENIPPRPFKGKQPFTLHGFLEKLPSVGINFSFMLRSIIVILCKLANTFYCTHGWQRISGAKRNFSA